MSLTNETYQTTSSSNSSAIEQAPGDIWQMLDVRLVLTIVYLAIFVIGVVGNICNCLVIADSKNRYMKTATNYYLFSLSVSDLLLLIFGLPHDIVNLWHPSPYLFGQFVCISRGWISEASTYASVLVIVAFTVERYIAICHPLKAHTLSRLSRSVKIIILIWLVASSCALLVVKQYGVIEIKEFRRPEIPGGQETEVATIQCTLVERNESIFELSVIIFFIIPMAVITMLYVRVGYHLRRKTQQAKRTQKQRTRRLNSSSYNPNTNKLSGRVGRKERRQSAEPISELRKTDHSKSTLANPLSNQNGASGQLDQDLLVHDPWSGAQPKEVADSDRKFRQWFRLLLPLKPAGSWQSHKRCRRCLAHKAAKGESVHDLEAATEVTAVVDTSSSNPERQIGLVTAYKLSRGEAHRTHHNLPPSSGPSSEIINNKALVGGEKESSIGEISIGSPEGADAPTGHVTTRSDENDLSPIDQEVEARDSAEYNHVPPPAATTDMRFVGSSSLEEEFRGISRGFSQTLPVVEISTEESPCGANFNTNLAVEQGHLKRADRPASGSSKSFSGTPTSECLVKMANGTGTGQPRVSLSCRDSTTPTGSTPGAASPASLKQTPIALQSTVNTTNMQNVIKMLVSVVVMFFICWAPFHAQRLMAVYVLEPTKEQEFIYILLNHISGISYYISAVVNPILYSLFSVKFRQAFRDTFSKTLKFCGRKEPASRRPTK